MSDERQRNKPPQGTGEGPPPEPPQPEHVALLAAQLTICNALQHLKPDAQLKVLSAVAVTLGLNGNKGNTGRPAGNNNQQQPQGRR